jgi:hypothetical protein
MNYKILILTLALFACVFVPFASAAHDYYPENKIVDTNPALSVPDPSTYGYVVFNIIAGGAQDKTVWVLNKANVNAAPFDCTFNPDKSERAGQNPDYTPIEVPGVGTTGILQYQSGSYTAYLQNGNGNQCERRDFIVGGASSSQATQVVFLGAAVSQLGEVDAGADVYTIIEATYGKTECSRVIDVAAIPKHTEYRYYSWHGWHKHYTEWSDTRRSCHDNEEQRTVVEVPATYKTVCSGETIDVTQNVKDVVNGGTTSFLFDNAHNPGGIWDISTTTLLSPIKDPAYPIVKNVMIKYSKNGVEKTINTMEYSIINL